MAVILFQDIPSRVNTLTNPSSNYEGSGGTPYPSVQYQLRNSCATNWQPFVTSINMNNTNGASLYSPTNLFSSDGTNDCIAYINKLTNMAGANQSLFISAAAASYGNTNWYFDDAHGAYSSVPIGLEALEGVESNGVPASAITYTPFTNATHITNATNVAGYFTWGMNGYLPGTYAIDGTIKFFGASGWYLIATGESFNGERYEDGQGNFLNWFSSNAFYGTSYSNTPIGAICHVDEPYAYADNSYDYFGFWASGKSFAVCVWAGQIGTYSMNGFPPGTTDAYFQAVGDPFVTK